jgi:hypothetical protein
LRPVLDVLRLSVVPHGREDEFAVEVHVNGVEMTARGAGLGMDPFDVLVPNRFVATQEPTTIPVARCECGVYGCGMTDVRITRDRDVVRWDWLQETPTDTPAIFDAAQYDAEVRRAGEDFAWETPARTTGRLLRARDDVRAALATHELRLDWTDGFGGGFQVCLAYRDSHQILLRFPHETPVEDVAGVLLTPPTGWRAAWHDMGRDAGPPSIAGPAWTRWET